MTKLHSFVKLDFMTIKPYSTVKSWLFIALLAVLPSIFTNNIASAIGVGMTMGTMFVTYPFAIGEKSNMDALYTTLSINRRTVVLGRYLFALTINLCVVVLCLGLTSIGQLITRLFHKDFGGLDAIGAIPILCVIFILIQAIQLPLSFKLGYSKAKFFSMVPLSLIMAAFVAFSMTAESDGVLGNVSRLVVRVLSENGIVVPLIVLGLCLVVFISYRLSVSFYKKREF